MVNGTEASIAPIEMPTSDVAELSQVVPADETTSQVARTDEVTALRGLVGRLTEEARLETNRRLRAEHVAEIAHQALRKRKRGWQDL